MAALPRLMGPLAAALLALAALAAPAAALAPGAAEVAVRGSPEERCQDPRLLPLVACNVCVSYIEPLEIHLPPDGDGPRFRCQDTEPPESQSAQASVAVGLQALAPECDPRLSGALCVAMQAVCDGQSTCTLYSVVCRASWTVLPPDGPAVCAGRPE